MGSVNQYMPPATSAELLQAQAELWCHTYGYLKSTALRCAIKLEIPNAISRCGRGGASLSDLHAALPAVAPSKRPCLSRLMRFLAGSGIFKVDDDHVVGVVRYHLTASSRLLVDDNDDVASLSPFTAGCVVPSYFMASLRLAEWLEIEDGGAVAETPFVMAHGTNFFGMVGRDAQFGAGFNEAMGSDSSFVTGIVVRELFACVRSLVDVGGGDGTMAKAIAEAFPNMRCSVLERPQLVDGLQAHDGKVEFVAGDMMEFIPPADAILLKFILHDWSDEDCVTILKRCKKAISARGPKGKVIIIDMVIGSAASKQTFEAQLLMDFAMMVLLTGKEREEEQWSRMFMDAGFTRYKISPILGTRSLIETSG
ncbi:hypothetical protein EJB05_02666, partial [Eragrostis curvula]